MKKLVSVLLSICLLLLMYACTNDAPTIIGVWETETSIFSAENDAESITIIFYNGIEGEEKHEKNDTTYKSYQFDYTVEDTVLTIYVGEQQQEYSIHFGTSNETDTMLLTAEDGTTYTYTLVTRRTPGIK